MALQAEEVCPDSTRALRALHGGREEPVTTVPEFIVNVLATPVGTVDVMTGHPNNGN
jgi:hypothetical protein